MCCCSSSNGLFLYRYSDCGTQTYGESDGAPYEASFNTHQVSIGLNWRF